MRIFIMFMCILASEDGIAQRIITGRVLDRNSRQPVEHVDVTVYKGTSYMSTNANGYFQLTVKDGDSLLFTHRDYLPGLIAVPEPDVFNVFIEKAVSYPVYEDGVTSLYEHIAQNLQYPSAALIRGVEGILLMEVNVDSSGSVANCKPLNELGGNCEKVATKVFMNIPGKWTRSGRTHSFIFPVIFRIANRETRLYYPEITLPEGKIMEEIIIASFN